MAGFGYGKKGRFDEERSSSNRIRLEWQQCTVDTPELKAGDDFFAAVDPATGDNILVLRQDEAKGDGVELRRVCRFSGVSISKFPMKPLAAARWGKPEAEAEAEPVRFAAGGWVFTIRNGYAVLERGQVGAQL
jgi:hypothetical protein